MMTVSIQSVHFDADQKLLNYIESKVQSLSRLLKGHKIHARIVLRLEKVSRIQDKIVEIIVDLPKKTCIAKSINKSFDKALAEALGSLKMQARKHMDKLQNE
ncbi:MAG: HPF/RaiA family ribosome-associated protein [Saprospiraceae bacterium]|nr:HPF/RaiA family ribosome-associated protein [Saprospiraceae bacterium]